MLAWLDAKPKVRHLLWALATLAAMIGSTYVQGLPTPVEANMGVAGALVLFARRALPMVVAFLKSDEPAAE